MRNRVKYGIVGTVIALVILFPVAIVVNYYTTPGKYDQFAACLTEKGATYYGAFWCPNCQNQKAMFGKSAKALNYIECSTPDRQSTQACLDAEITKYPTWRFADGTEVTGTQSLDYLAEQTQCELPA